MNIDTGEIKPEVKLTQKEKQSEQWVMMPKEIKPDTPEAIYLQTANRKTRRRLFSTYKKRGFEAMVASFDDVRMKVIVNMIAKQKERDNALKV